MPADLPPKELPPKELPPKELPPKELPPKELPPKDLLPEEPLPEEPMPKEPIVKIDPRGPRLVDEALVEDAAVQDHRGGDADRHGWIQRATGDRADSVAAGRHAGGDRKAEVLVQRRLDRSDVEDNEAQHERVDDL